MLTLYNVVLSTLPSNTLYWTLSGYMKRTIWPSGGVSMIWVPWCGNPKHRHYMPTFTSIADVCDFYGVEIETAYHMAYRNGWKVK